jgi:thiosulfate/3-mercaptopyruvate sulfurtransferase
MPRLAPLLLLTLALAACRGPDPGRAADDAPLAPAHPQLLVSAGELAGALGEPDLVVLHVAGDEAAYRAGHIPGARFIAVGSLNAERDGVPGLLATDDALRAAFAAAGVTEDARVVVYGEPLPAARAFVALEHLGHQRVALLDGGLVAWREAGQPLATEPAQRAESAGNVAFEPRGSRDPVVDAEFVHARLGDAAVTLIDARPPDQYSGAVAGDAVPRAGHIPGAASVFWERLIESTERPVLLDADALRGLFHEAGADDGELVVTYCRTGMQASFAYFVARYLGYDVRIYDGSFVDWSPRTELPVAR